MGDESPAFLVWGDGAAYHRVAGAALEEGVRTGDRVSSQTGAETQCEKYINREKKS